MIALLLSLAMSAAITTQSGCQELSPAERSACVFEVTKGRPFTPAKTSVGVSISSAEGCAALDSVEREACLLTVTNGHSFAHVVPLTSADASSPSEAEASRQRDRDVTSIAKSLQTIAVVQVVSLVIGLLGIIAAFTA